MKTKFIIASILGAAVTLSSAASAQEKVTVNGNIDLVITTYGAVWTKTQVFLCSLLSACHTKDYPCRHGVVRA